MYKPYEKEHPTELYRTYNFHKEDSALSHINRNLTRNEEEEKIHLSHTHSIHNRLMALEMNSIF